jgi:hypothetical protein
MIELTGRSKSICKAELKFATIFFAQYLVGNRLANNLHIDIDLRRLDGIADGYCHPYEAGKNPRMFEIAINSKFSRHKILQILAHEMVHVKQYARNELQSDSPASASFAGKAYKITSSLEDYLNYPWEIEAFGREKGMVLLYSLALRQAKVKFRNGKIYMNGKYVKLDKMKISM